MHTSFVQCLCYQQYLIFNDKNNCFQDAEHTLLQLLSAKNK